LAPSAEHAAEVKYKLQAGPTGVIGSQFLPELVENYTTPFVLQSFEVLAATNVVPSAEDATAVQLLNGASVGVQVAPELVDV
jgi:hypothetical protein